MGFTFLMSSRVLKSFSNFPHKHTHKPLVCHQPGHRGGAEALRPDDGEGYPRQDQEAGRVPYEMKTHIVQPQTTREVVSFERI